VPPEALSEAVHFRAGVGKCFRLYAGDHLREAFTFRLVAGENRVATRLVRAFYLTSNKFVNKWRREQTNRRALTSPDTL
jgi:hypothetical protein